MLAAGCSPPGLGRLLLGEIRNSIRRNETFGLASARRAFARVARQLRAENRRLGLPLIAVKNGRVRLVDLNGSKP